MKQTRYRKCSRAIYYTSLKISLSFSFFFFFPFSCRFGAGFPSSFLFFFTFIFFSNWSNCYPCMIHFFFFFFIRAEKNQTFDIRKAFLVIKERMARILRGRSNGARANSYAVAHAICVILTDKPCALGNTLDVWVV